MTWFWHLTRSNSQLPGCLTSKRRSIDTFIPALRDSLDHHISLAIVLVYLSRLGLVWDTHQISGDRTIALHAAKQQLQRWASQDLISTYNTCNRLRSAAEGEERIYLLCPELQSQKEQLLPWDVPWGSRRLCPASLKRSSEAFLFKGKSWMRHQAHLTTPLAVLSLSRAYAGAVSMEMG